MRNFSACESKWLLQLDGIELASFWRRALAFGVDLTLIAATLLVLGVASLLLYLQVRKHTGHPMPTRLGFSLGPGKLDVTSDDPDLDKHFDNEYMRVASDILVSILYFGLFTWHGKGRTPGKRLTHIPAVSIVHPHLTFWHSVERALGYGAATLEFGFGFVQFFIHPYRRCAQDRLAETIVVTERGYKAMRLFPKSHSRETKQTSESLESR